MPWAGVALCVAACSPPLDWRAITVPGAPLTLHFPCKPDHFSRRLRLAGEALEVGVSSCAAEAQTFAVTAVDMGGTDRAGAGLAALREAIGRNFAGAAQALPARRLSGGRSEVSAEQFSAQAPRPEGPALQARLLLFSQGSWVYQVTVMGERLQPEALDFFFDSVKPIQ